MPPTAIRIGIIGLGSMGMRHAGYLAAGAIHHATLAALCTRNPACLADATKQFPAALAFTSREKFFASNAFDAVLIATPHYDHPQTIRDAFANNLHVLVEKPLAVTIKAARQIVAESAAYPRLKFGVMYNQRTNPLHQKIRALIHEGALGKIQRITWIITHWFRPDAYYASSPWRGTWKGEGGGVLINQSLHNLDLLHWLTGRMPTRVTAIATAGKFHPIEVEDDAGAILEYADGGIAHFITSTGEHPGCNRLEIAGTKGRIVAENNAMVLTRNSKPSNEFSRTSSIPFSAPETMSENMSFGPPSQNEHQIVTQNFVDAVGSETPNETLLAPGAEGVHAVELANAILMAGLTREPVELPLDAEKYELFLAARGSAATHVILE